MRGEGVQPFKSNDGDVWVLASAGRVGYGATPQEAIDHWVSIAPPSEPRYFITVKQDAFKWYWECTCGRGNAYLRHGRERALAEAEDHATGGAHLEQYTIKAAP